MSASADTARAPSQLGLAVVIPIRDEGMRFARFLEDLLDCPETPVTEFVVIDDGSSPAMQAIQARAVESATERLRREGRPHRVRLVVASANAGKGAAIRRGWAAASPARWLAFVDGDGAVPAREVWRLAGLLHAASPFDALLSSRARAPGHVVRRKPLRALQGAMFASLANALLGLGVRDPQCGLKYFRAERLLPHLEGLRERGWTLDPEILLLLRKSGAAFREEPIDWEEHGASKVIPGVDAVRMFLEVLRLRRRIGAARRP